MNKINHSSPAKINLFLEIKGRREDGYHEITSWLHTIDLCDDITVSRSKNEYSTLKSDDTEIPFGKRNLCIKAFEAVRDNSTMSPGDTVEIDLKKRIPLGSGFGGGSSNAASVINGLNKLFKLGLAAEDRLRLAAQVGSDVPFFIRGGSAIATGRGEKLHPLPPLPRPVWIVAAMPDFSVSTGDAYKWVKDYAGRRELDIKELEIKIETGDLEYILEKSFSAFEEIVAEKHPEIKELIRKAVEAGCLKAQLNGSGSGIFGICENESAARAAANELTKDETVSFVTVCRTL